MSISNNCDGWFENNIFGLFRIFQIDADPEIYIRQTKPSSLTHSIFPIIAFCLFLLSFDCYQNNKIVRNYFSLIEFDTLTIIIAVRWGFSLLPDFLFQIET